MGAEREIAELDKRRDEIRDLCGFVPVDCAGPATMYARARRSRWLFLKYRIKRKIVRWLGFPTDRRDLY